jgi:D-alanine-D-alanine ligase
MVEKIRIGVIFGGRSGEHEVSLMSARSVLSVLDPQKYAVTEIGITHEGNWLTGTDVLAAFEKNDLKNLVPAVLLPEPEQKAMLYTREGAALKPITHLDVIFPVLHGTFGEDGTLQGMLELADVAYIGAGVLGASVGMDKILFKDVMRANDIPVVDSLNFTRRQGNPRWRRSSLRSKTTSPSPCSSNLPTWGLRSASPNAAPALTCLKD